MNTPLELRPEVLAFAQNMEARLRQNDHRGGWEECSDMYLLSGALKNMHTVTGALSDAHTPRMIELHTADAANFLMMLVDNHGLLLPSSLERCVACGSAVGPFVRIAAGCVCYICADQVNDARPV